MIRNPRTGRMVKKDGKVGKQVMEEAAVTVQKMYRGKRNRNDVRQMSMTMPKFLREAEEAGFDKRYAKEFVNAHDYFPTMKELNKSLNSDFARNFKTHFGYNNLKPGNKVNNVKKEIDKLAAYYKNNEERNSMIDLMKSLGMI